MLKRIISLLGLIVLLGLGTGVLSAAAPMPPAPTVTFTVVSAPPAVMHVGDEAAFVVTVQSSQEMLFAQMLPTFHFPGRGVMAVNMGGDRSVGGTTATLTITLVAKNVTAGLPAEGVVCENGVPSSGGVAPVAFMAGARFQNGLVVPQRFPASGFYCITVLP